MNNARKQAAADKPPSHDEVLRRTDALLRNMLNSPHVNHVPKKKPKKRAK